MVYKTNEIKVMQKFIAVFVVFFFISCVAQDFPSVSAEESYKMRTDKDSIVFVDVRTEGEFNGPLGHIEDAILLPLHRLEEDISTLDDYKNYEVIVYCRSGNRSQGATRFLRKNGFDAKNMLGGIKVWNKIKDKN